MPLGPFYDANQTRISTLREQDWKVALVKSKEHIKLRLWKKTLSGAHSATNLGADPTDYYLGIAYEKILSGEWEWKESFSLTEQMCRIIDSYMSKEVDRVEAGTAHVSTMSYIDDLAPFYEQVDETGDQQEAAKFDARVRAVEEAISGDTQLELVVEALKEGMKRADIAELLDLQPRQFDKLREKLIKKVKENQLTIM